MKKIRKIRILDLCSIPSDASNRLATTHQRHSLTERQAGQYRQRSDSIGRTLLETVVQTPKTIKVASIRRSAQRVRSFVYHYCDVTSVTGSVGRLSAAACS